MSPRAHPLVPGLCLLLALGPALSAPCRAEDEIKTARWFTSLAEARSEPDQVLKLDLSGQNLAVLPPEVLELRQLRLLLLNGNRLAELPAELGRLNRLSELELNDNAFTTFPPAILGLASLNELELSGNRLTTLPSDLDRLAQLTELELINNQLTTLPPALARLPHLEELKLDRNRLTDLPAAVFSLPALLELTVSDNLLTTLPPEIGASRSLRQLDVSRNRLVELPAPVTRLRLAAAHVWQDSLRRLPDDQLAWLVATPDHDLAAFVFQLAEARRAGDVAHYFAALTAAARSPAAQAGAGLVGARAYRDLGDSTRARAEAQRAHALFTRLDASGDDDDDRSPGADRQTVNANRREAATLLALLETEARQARLRLWFRTALAAGLLVVAAFLVLLARSHRRLRAAHLQLARQNERLEEQAARLARLNATKDKLFSLIGHDLRGPLSALGTLSARLRPELATVSGHRLVSLFEGAALQLSALLDNLLRWAQSQTRETGFAPAFLDLGELVTSVVAQYRALLAVKDIELQVDIPPGLHLYGDATMLSTVVRNLLANAVKFSETGDRITLTATSDFGEVALEVADTGIGMTTTQIAGLFSPDAARSIDGTAGERGAGLGLLLCDEFVRRHEGRIEVRSTPGEGSVFRVVLPACGLAAAV